MISAINSDYVWPYQLRDESWWRFGSIRVPDREITPLLLDPKVREYEGWDYPFPDQRNGEWAGCYLWYSCGSKLVPPTALYAGQTVNFGIRLQLHWKGHWGFLNGQQETFLDRMYDDVGIEKYWDDMLIGLWFIPDKRERNLFEHKLIGNLKPRYNIK